MISWLLHPFAFLPGGLSRQKIEPNAGIIEQHLYFKGFIEQQLDIRIEKRKFKNANKNFIRSYPAVNGG